MKHLQEKESPMRAAATHAFPGGILALSFMRFWNLAAPAAGSTFWRQAAADSRHPSEGGFPDFSCAGYR